MENNMEEVVNLKLKKSHPALKITLLTPLPFVFQNVKNAPLIVGAQKCMPRVVEMFLLFRSFLFSHFELKILQIPLKFVEFVLCFDLNDF
jgi:hypothetical protein